jgi:starch-binding outer membrane protein, SusD/RagB family
MKRYRFNLISLGIVTLLFLSMIGCNQDEFLENINKSNLDDGTQWAGNANADIFLNDIYGELINKWNSTENIDYYTDDYNISHYYTASNWRIGICQAPASSSTNPWGGTQGPVEDISWSAFFTKLRKANTFLQKTEANKANFSTSWYNMRVDEARFLRAYFYSEMFMHHGGLPIITVPLDRSSMSEDELQFPRETFANTFDFIINELDDIVKNGYLPVKYSAGNAGAGRATLGSALALKGWLELFAASALFNSGTPYLADPENYVHFATPRPNLYAQAAATNKKFIDDYGNGKFYNLFGDLANMWRAANDYNSEVIWDRQVVANIGNSGPGTQSMGGNYERRGGVTYVLGQYMTWGNYNPTQEVVDAFRMANGKTITDPTSGYDPQNPYVNREPRFYMWIVYDGAPYKLDWMPRTDTIYTRIDQVRPSVNQIDLAGNTDVGDSGYYQKKKMNPDAAPADNANGTNFVYYRYAEVLLNYAEAQNEAAGPDATVYDAINKIRKRAGIPDLEQGLTKDQMRLAIRNERRVELCFEGKRYHDNKRWKTAEVVMNARRHNMVIRNSVPANNSGVWVYSVEPEVKFTPKFDLKQYMTPIPQNVIDQNSKVKQNPGY